MSGAPATEGSTASVSRRRSALYFLLRLSGGLAVSAFFIWLSLRGSDLSAVVDGLREVHLLSVVACIGLLLLAHVLRTARWALLLAPHGSFSAAHVNRAAAVGFMTLLILPMRLGELGRPWLISRPDPERGRRSPVAMSAAMGTLVFERILDGLLLTAVLFCSLHLLSPAASAANWLRAGSGLLFAAFCALAFVAWLASKNKDGASRLLGRLSALLGERARAFVETGTGRLVGGFRGPERGLSRLAYLLCTLAYWAATAGAILVLARGFGLDVSFPQAVVVLCAQVVGVMIPAGPGMLGTFQYFTILGLSFFVPPEAVRGPAVAFANAYWACIFAQQVGLGLLLLPRREKVLTRLAGGEARQEAETAGSQEAA
ncbi:MAG: lysylphosphatidylglycerol synthase transmembrane domain-containing protein [Myxococcota bacterium]